MSDVDESAKSIADTVLSLLPVLAAASAESLEKTGFRVTQYESLDCIRN